MNERTKKKKKGKHLKYISEIAACKREDKNVLEVRKIPV